MTSISGSSPSTSLSAVARSDHPNTSNASAAKRSAASTSPSPHLNPSRPSSPGANFRKVTVCKTAVSHSGLTMLLESLTKFNKVLRIVLPDGRIGELALSAESLSVESAIFLLVNKYGLRRRPGDYELRCIEDDDDEGSTVPDLDLPPLQARADLKKFRVDALALCPRSSSNKRCVESSRRKLLEVVMPHNALAIVNLEDGMDLNDVLHHLSKRRQVTFEADEYMFFYSGGNEALDHSLRVEDLQHLNLELRRISEQVTVLPASEVGCCCPNDFVFTEESASTYTEFAVKKRNRWGRKQARRLGIDRHTLYNGSLVNTSDASVKRVARAISDVVDVKWNTARPRCFEVLFRQRDSSEVHGVQYEAVSDYEGAEIVARINFLRRLPLVRDTPSSSQHSPSFFAV